jgi:hypothetical protein
MKTKLKVGDKVFDSALFGNVEGEVISVNEDSPYPIFVAFGDNQENYTIDGRYNKWTNHTLSMQPYDKLSEIVPAWEEEEVWGIFWDNDKTKTKMYGQMKLSDNIEYSYKCITDMGMINFKNFKETGKLI